VLFEFKESVGGILTLQMQKLDEAIVKDLQSMRLLVAGEWCLTRASTVEEYNRHLDQRNVEYA
jgi:hypothetical protein